MMYSPGSPYIVVAPVVTSWAVAGQRMVFLHMFLQARVTLEAFPIVAPRGRSSKFPWRGTSSSPHWCSLFPQYFECAALHRVGSTWQAKKKALKCIIRIFQYVWNITVLFVTYIRRREKKITSGLVIGTWKCANFFPTTWQAKISIKRYNCCVFFKCQFLVNLLVKRTVRFHQLFYYYRFIS